MPVGIFVLISAITALSVYAIEEAETQRADALNRQTTLAVTTALERLANANTVYLRAGAALLSLQQPVSRETFAEFARQLDSDTSLRGGGALGWLVVVQPDQVAAFQQEARAAGLVDYTIRPAPVNRPAVAVLFVEPDNAVSRKTLGFDMMSDPIRRSAVRRAIRSGRPSATGPMELMAHDGSGSRTGFGIFVPVYRGMGNGREPVGVIARAFPAQAFIQAALGPEQVHGYGVALYDGEMPGHVRIAAVGEQAPPERRVVREIVIADHRMRVEISPPAGTALSNMSLLTLLFGVLAAALLLVVARLVTHNAAEDRAALAWFEEQASIRNSLTRELNHRVKNTLANVLSIVALTRRRTDDIDEFVGGLIGRIRALSATHDLLTQSEWGTIPIRAVVSAELAPYHAHEPDRAVTMRGPNVELAPNDALSLGLAIHELATNASKYGALSAVGGRVQVSWEMITDKLARIEWSEHGGPPVAKARRRGFGTELIEKIVAHELKNPVELRFDRTGVRCTLIVPVRTRAPFQLRGQDPG